MLEVRKYESHWYIQCEADNDSWETDLDSDNIKMKRACMEFWNGVKEDLAQYVDDDLFFIESISLDLIGDTCIATVKLDPTLAPEDMDIDERIIEYLTGQYADGFGEGLEQQSFYTEEDEVWYIATDIDDEGEEYEYDDYNIENIDYYIKLWDSKIFRMKRIK